MEKLGNVVRKLKYRNRTYNVYAVYVTKNFWEFYQFEPEDSDGICFGLVCGLEDELGYFSLEEIGPYIVSRVSGMNLEEALPPTGGEWLNYDTVD